MSKKHLGIIAVVSVIAVCGASIGYIAYSGVWEDWFAGEWTNGYRYLFYIDSTDELHNVTLYIPALMVKGEIASIVKDINNDSSKPSDWVCEYIDTEQGKMLKISAEYIKSGYHSILIETYNVTHFINTEHPVGNEPVFYPRFNETYKGTVPGTVGIKLYSFQSHIYASYNTSYTTKCEIRLRFEGSRYRGIIWGSELRDYEDVINYTITGEISNWLIANGTLEI